MTIIEEYDLDKCPKCGGPADNGHDRCVPPTPYYCTKCTEDQNDIVYRLEKRAEIRRQISTRKSVQEGKPDRISDLLEEAASIIRQRDAYIRALQQDNKELRRKTNEAT